MSMYPSQYNTSSQSAHDEEDYPLYSLKDISFEDNCRIFDFFLTFSERNDVWVWR